MGQVIWMPKHLTKDRFYFDDETSYQVYLRAEKEEAKAPTRIEFDWKLLLKILFGRFK
jgi:hypothetical protein